ncbi:YbfB/YjiJ family MFS transporter [Rhizobium sp. KVB221]|uniref:YbfB/YjiJ family MFS transporter n=1 Tax=Rhizobium setariae TaxID=2801340 RepID=A0A937CN43_9HYPH|nr:YbfB/YjiJ family MFS transporter [Rhizobium setariae]MBL0370733.1 YbfB/YjiJ family MFS transporter [Rhizobium setariae]
MSALHTSKSLSDSPIAVAIAGAVSLSVAMGIGRFAFTPLLPMMLHDGLLDINGGSLLATANYVGYLAGALLCMVLPAIVRLFTHRPIINSVMVRGALIATTALTLGMAFDLPYAWPALRFLSGVISAGGFVYTAGWCLGRLEELGASRLGGVIFTGPGVGIALSGLSSYGISLAGGSSTMGWIGFGVLAAVLTILVWRIFHGGPKVALKTVSDPASVRAAKPRFGSEHMLLTLAYGLAGFGYIITATFLPVIAREALPGSMWIELFWPIFGLAVMAGALLTQRVALHIDRRLMLIVCYLVQATGVVASLFLPNIGGFILGSLLVGLPFTAITLFAMQEVRRLMPAHATSFMALMTAAYGIGQIAGPPLVATILAHSSSHATGFATSLAIASGSLVFGALLYGLQIFRHPSTRSTAFANGGSQHNKQGA